MTRLSVVSGDECIAALEKLGYREARTKGSHVWLVSPGHPPLPVPRHEVLGKGLLRRIIHMANISVEEFNELLHQ